MLYIDTCVLLAVLTPETLSLSQAEAVLQGFEHSLDAPLLAVVHQLDLHAQWLGAGEPQPRNPP